MSSLIGDCKNCGHDQTKHKGIDPKLRLASRCTALQVHKALTEARGVTVTGPLRCECTEYITSQKDRV